MALLVLQIQVVYRPMLLALVDEEEAVEAPPPAEVDEEMARYLTGREEVAPPAAHEHPASGKPSSEERRHLGIAHLPYQAWCNVCVTVRGRENRYETRSQAQPSALVIHRDHCFLPAEESAPMMTVW